MRALGYATAGRVSRATIEASAVGRVMRGTGRFLSSRDVLGPTLTPAGLGGIAPKDPTDQT